MPALARYERLAAWLPVAVVAYVAWQLVVRLLLSDNLELDEAELVRYTDFALGYDNSQPPLYTWFVISLWRLTGSWVLALAFAKHLLLAATALLLFDAVRRATGRALPAALTTMALALLPQVIWKAQVTLSHSLLAMAAAVAVLHALVLVAARQRPAAFVWLGVAAGCGLLAKYNFVLFLLALAVAAMLVAPVRQALLRPGLTLAVVVAAVMTGPHLAWAVAHAQDTTRRLQRLEQPDAWVGSLDVPALGLDGFLSLGLKALAWAGPLIMFWSLARWRAREERRSEPTRPLAGAIGRCAGLCCLFGLGLWAALVLLGDLHSVDERYLTPVLMALPVWMALAWPLDHSERGTRLFAGCAGVVVAGVLVAWPATILLGSSRYAYPYDAIAADMRDLAGPAPFAVLASRHDHAGNIVMRIPGTRVWTPGMAVAKVAVVWDGAADKGEALAVRLGATYRPLDEARAFTHRYRYFSGRLVTVQARLYGRQDD